MAPLPWNERMYSDKQPLRIAYLEYDGFNHATPAMLRALREAKVTTA